MASELKTTAQGDLIIPAKLLGALSGRSAQDMRLLNVHKDLLICASALPGEGSRPVLYGDLRLLSVGEIVALIASMRRSGSLALHVPHARKVIYFSSGQIVYATSNVEDDRLGEVLWRRGYLKLEQLSEVHDLVTPQKKLGAVLTERGFITPRQLYEGIKEQVLEIVYSAFHFERGEFIFIDGKVKLRGKVRLEMSTREVIMEGVRRVEELTRLEELFPERESVLVRRPVRVEADLEDVERRLLGLVDGKVSVAEIIEESRLGEIEALRALARLRRVGVIEVRERADEEEREIGDLPGVLEVYSRLLRIIHQTLAAETPDYLKRLNAYLGNPAPAHADVFRNVGFDEAGKLDMDTLYRNARARQPDDPRALALEALRAFFDYAQFQAMDVLDDDICDAMMDKIQRLRSEMND
jgi:hypothetical protein